ncbi:hypothetical protein PFMALIP_05892, partial [Plasmodium falciparum MaliPS096_E11]
MAAAAKVGGSPQDAKDAKELLDRIGEDIYKKIKDDSNVFRDYLKGNLASATNRSPELIDSIDTCQLVKQYISHGGDAGGERYPCKKDRKGNEVPRFSNSVSGQCTNEKMRSGGKGACAPYRRLHLCHHNLESIDTDKINSGNARHKLLAEVCYAAKYEGESLVKQYEEYIKKNRDFNICTVLARSFADIGDIRNGKETERDKLQQNLKDIFKEIHGGLTTTNGKNGKKSAKDHYKKDKETGNYYQLREDWWYANRETVWKALTCNAPEKAHYFKPSENNTQYFSNIYCGGKQEGYVPTNLDYVPQFLRWFDEWSEDFCRLKKIKLDNVKNACRGDKNEKYCSYNGYDCKKTNRSKNVCFWSSECTNCLVECKPYELWIVNQGKEFEKQKEKYEKEMNGNTSQKD